MSAAMQNTKIFKIPLAKVHPPLIAKVEKQY